MASTSAETDKILLSPLGLSPGLLYSALLTIKPLRLVVLTSDQGEELLGEILEKAAFHGSVAVVKVDDPFSCFDEAREKAGKIIKYLLGEQPGAKSISDDRMPGYQIIINLTGGTTALQFIIQRAGAELERTKHNISYAALLDRRSTLAQRENPWVVGDLIPVV